MGAAGPLAVRCLVAHGTIYSVSAACAPCSRRARASSSICRTRLRGRISVQVSSVQARQLALFPLGPVMRQPAGTSTKSGQSEDWPSSLTSTRKAPFSSSKGLLIFLLWAERQRLGVAQSRISHAGDADMRFTLYSAANAMLMRSIAWSSLKAWGVRLMKTKGRRRAIVAVARKIAVVLHRMWIEGSEFRLGSEEAAA